MVIFSHFDVELDELNDSYKIIVLHSIVFVLPDLILQSIFGS